MLVYLPLAMATYDDFQFYGQYLGRLRTYSLHKQSGDTIKTDAPRDNQGEGQHFSPTDLLANALGTCIITVMGIKARAEKISMEGATFHVKKKMASNPRRISEVEVHIYMPSHDYSDREKKILEKAAHHCPVANSLHPDVSEIILFHWSDEV